MLRLLTNEWDKVKCKGFHRKFWLAQVEFSKKKTVGSSRPNLGHKTNQKALDKRECEEFEMALQHKPKLRVYRELKQEVGFEEYLEYVKEATYMLFKVSFWYQWVV